jgi:integrase
MASILRRGNAWRAMVRRKGEVLRRTFDTREQAEAWAEKEDARIRAGVARPPVEAAFDASSAPSVPLVSDLFDRYAREVTPNKDGAKYEVYRLRYLVRDFALMPVAQLDGAAMAEWRDKRLKQVSAGSVNRELNLISAVFSRAIKEWRAPLTVNPVSQIQRPRQPAARRRRVSDAERGAILDYFKWDGLSSPENGYQWTAWAFDLALSTMMRLGEIAGLVWEHVHLEKRFCHLPRTKNGHSRDVPLSTRAIALFAMLPVKETGRIIPVTKGTLGTYFWTATRALGIKDMHFHDSRREAITRASAKLSNVLELSRASGHRGFKSLSIYYQPDITELAEKLG